MNIIYIDIRLKTVHTIHLHIDTTYKTTKKYIQPYTYTQKNTEWIEYTQTMYTRHKDLDIRNTYNTLTIKYIQTNYTQNRL